MSAIRWPRVLNPTQLSQLISAQNSPLKALKIFNEAKVKYPNYCHNSKVYATMINILGNTCRISEMKQVIDQMKHDSCQCQDSIFVYALKTYAMSGLIDEAVSLFKSLPQFNCVSWTNSFNTILEIMVKENRLESACRVFLEHSHGWEVKSRTKSLTLLIEALCRIQKPDLALCVLQEMDYQGCYPQRETYRILMKGLCEEGMFNEATHLLYSMFWRISLKGSGGDVAIYKILLDSFCDNGMIKEAGDFLGKILKKGLKAPKRCHKQLDLGRLYDERMDAKEAKDLINEALIKGLVPSSESYKTMAVDFFCEGKIEEGNKVLDEMNKKGFTILPSIYEVKIDALCRQGRIDEAVEVIEKEMIYTNCVPTVKLYNNLVKGLCDAKRADVAVHYLRKMSWQLGCIPDRETYTILVDGLCRNGRYTEASEVLEEMSIRSYYPNAQTYNSVIRGLCMADRSYGAIIWLEEMISQDKVPDYYAWASLVSSFCSHDVISEILAERLERLRKS
ncbi:hypothetical protein Leryth_004438 [Lithospermum erythrorhizon]|nr:hypothetical protein Leryth_004438 [Lithospermum erythrorhizon]